MYVWLDVHEDIHVELLNNLNASDATDLVDHFRLPSDYMIVLFYDDYNSFFFITALVHSSI